MAAFTGRKRPSRFKPLPAPAQRVDLRWPRRLKSDYLQDGARETGLGHWLPGFLRSHEFSKLSSHRLTMPKEN